MTFKAGLIGFGYWGSILLRNFNSNNDVEIKTICDRNTSKLKNASSFSPKSHVSQDAENIFNDADIDFVIIATQGSSHYNLVRRSLLSGKHVFVEKPFALNLKQAEELNSLNKECDLLIMVDHTFLFSPEYKIVKDILKKNELGKLLNFHSTRTDFGKFQNDVSILGHLMYHDAYILLDLFGEPDSLEIKASGSAHIVDSLEDTALVSIVYPAGFNAEIINNMLQPTKERKIILTGDKAILLWDDMALDGNKLKFYNKNVFYDKKEEKFEYKSNGPSILLKVSKKQALENEIIYFISCLKNNRKPMNNECSALKVMSFLEKIQNSMLRKG